MLQQTPGCGANQDPSLVPCLCLARLSSVPGTAQQQQGQHRALHVPGTFSLWISLNLLSQS